MNGLVGGVVAVGRSTVIRTRTNPFALEDEMQRGFDVEFELPCLWLVENSYRKL